MRTGDSGLLLCEGPPEEMEFPFSQDYRGVFKSDAISAFHRVYPPHLIAWYEVVDELPPGIGPIYSRQPLTNCWFVKFGFASEWLVLRSSRVVVVSKSTGDIVFDGELNDEG